MRIAILLDPTRLRLWHRWTLDALLARGLRDFEVRMVQGLPEHLPTGLDLLLRLERLSKRYPAPCALDTLQATDLPLASTSSSSNAPEDLVIDLRGAAAHADHALVPLFDNAPEERSMWLALLARRAPMISLTRAGLTNPAAMPALEDPHVLSASATMTLARVAEAVAAEVASIAAGRPLARRVMENRLHYPISSAGSKFSRAFAARKLSSMLTNRIAARQRWIVAYRRTPDCRTHLSSRLDISAYTKLPDDGARFYADPFVFALQGALHLFVEEFPYATQRGMISHSVLGPDGRFGTPRPVLERPYHLSYPQVFSHGDHIWMIPESSASGAIELYRADPFPYRFVLHDRLIEGRHFDATLFTHGGRLWIASGSHCAGGSSWDALSMFYADRLEGPWRPHTQNPVIIDARCARPAGQFFRSGSQLWRPGQDCTGGYGSALTLSRVDALPPDDFVETTVSRHAFSDGGRILGPHTLNWCAGIETTDIFTSSSVS